MMPGAGMMGWGGVGMGGGGLLMLLIWVVVIVAAVLGVRWLWDQGQPRRPPQDGDRALEILRTRYARGEIDREEFEERRRDLLAAENEAQWRSTGPTGRGEP
ncbi:MAG: SHOCT domain-containing protein [Deltaproteobacteria bacterium]|nr:SHOCT domain-containing protein [Deltaproteobacteria bacterium]